MPDAAGHRAHVDDVAAVADVREAEPRHAHEPVDVRVEHRVLVLFARLGERSPAEREPGVVEEDVDASERLDGGRDEAFTALRIDDVELELDVGLEPVDAPGAAGDANAGILQRARGRLPDSGRCARDDRRLAGEVKCRHGAMLSSTGCERCATWSTWSVTWWRW